MPEKLIVIGGTAAGLSAASRAIKNAPDMEIKVFERGGHIGTGACGLPYYVGGLIKDARELFSFTPEALRAERNIEALTRHEVLSIDRNNQTVKVRNLISGDDFDEAYDKLVIATGAKPILPSIEGVEQVFTLRDIEDANAMRAAIAKGARSALIIGGGPIALEMAEQLLRLNLSVDIVEAQSHVLPALKHEYADIIETELKSRGAKVHLTHLADADMIREIRADMVICAIGVQPESSLAADCGLEIGLKGGVVVDSSLRTSDDHIWACGDCVETTHILTKKPTYAPLGTHANKQGRVAGDNLSGGISIFPGVLGSQITKMFDYFIAATGLTLEQAKMEGFDPAETSIVKGDRASYYPGGVPCHISLVYARNGGRLLGAQAIGGSSVLGRIDTLVAAITAGMTVRQLNDLDLLYTPSAAPVYDPLRIAASQAMKRVVG